MKRFGKLLIALGMFFNNAVTPVMALEEEVVAEDNETEQTGQEEVPSEQPLPTEETIEEYSETVEGETCLPSDIDGMYETVTEDLFFSYLSSNANPQSVSVKGKTNTKLSGINKYFYSELKNYISEVAEGNRESTIFEISIDDFEREHTMWSASELGVEKIVENNEILPAAIEALNNKDGFDLTLILRTLLHDCPFELYWYDKTLETETSGMSITTSWDSERGEYLIGFVGSISFFFPVAQEYSAGSYTVDTVIGQSVQTITQKALSIVNKYADLDDDEKLSQYKTEICDLVSYNNSAAGGGIAYGNPWQLIWVFDDNPDTNVVCEGYAKAFQYLCNLTDFKANVNCITVTGTMAGGTGEGPHMWNIVTMEDGKNYLVDVTNCDENTIGADDLLFLVGYNTGSVETGYSFDCTHDTVSYVYDDIMFSVFNEKDLIISSDNYQKGNIIHNNGLIYDISSGNEAVLTGIENDVNEAVIAETVSGLPVSKIADSAFEGCSVLESITIPGSVSVIGENAFAECEKLNLVRMNSGIQQIAANAFEGDKLTILYSGTKNQWEQTSVLDNGTMSSVADKMDVFEDITVYFGVTEMPTVTFSETDILLSLGESLKIEAENLVEGDAVVSWESENNGVITVTNDGTVTAVGVGTTRVNVTLQSGYKTGIEVEVEEESGADKCGKRLTWTYDNGTLTITGKGDMWDYGLQNGENPPWSDYRESITHIIFGPEVTSIGDYAFYNCSNITNAELPVSLTKIGKFAFFKCAGLTGINIPEGVTKVGESAFEECEGIQSAYVPATLSDAGQSIFQRCINLKNVTLADGLQVIPSAMFADCSSLESIDIPESVTKIGPMAFIRCQGLTTIYIPKNVSNIEGSNLVNYFEGCVNLTNIEVDPENQYYKSVDGALYTKNGTVVICCPQGKEGEFNIPDTVSSIWDFAFYGCDKLTNIYIPDSVLEIGMDSFTSCSRLTEIVIPGNARFRYDSPFGNCTSLERIELRGECSAYHTEDGVLFMDDVEMEDGSHYSKFLYCYPAGKKESFYQLPEGTDAIGFHAFSYTKNLKSVELPDSVLWLGNGAFYESGIESIVLPDGLKTILDSAFYHCGSLKRIVVPDSVINIEGEYILAGCDNLETIICSNTSEMYKWAVANGYSSLVDLGYGNIEDTVWTAKILDESSCLIMNYSGTDEEVIVPNNIKGYTVNGIAEKVFENHSEIKSVSIPDCVKIIGKNAFNNCAGLETINLPEGLTEIAEALFQNCKNLKEIEIPETVTKIGTWAFRWCRNITAIEIPDSVLEIGNGAFTACSNLETIILPKNLKSIQSDMFSKCEKLFSIFIPENVNEIGVYVFEECTSLKYIYFGGNAPKFGEKVFYKTGETFAIYSSDKSGWTDNVKQNYGGNIVWTAKQFAHPGTYHQWSEWNILKEATEEEEGLEDRTCTLCEEKETRVIAKIVHKYSLSEWKWSEDNSTAEAEFICADDSSHKETVPATVTSETVAATCETEGKTTYTAKIVFEGKEYTCTKEISIPATGHNYSLSEWKWSEDNSTAEAEFVCANDSSHKETVPATVTSETVAATCEVAGRTTYTAKVTFEGKEYTDTKEVTISALGHDYGEWKVTKPATCTEDGTETRSCSHDASHTETRAITKTGHNYVFSEWKWGEDNSTAEAVFICANDSSHKETILATITSETVAATCESTGKTTYIAKASFEGKEYTDTKERTLSALGHDYGEWRVTKLATCTEDGTETRTCSHNASHTETRVIPKTGHKYSLSEWKWREDNSTAEAVFICANDSSHKETVSASITSNTVDAKCEEAGKTTYTAKVTFEGKEYTDTKEIAIPATGHDYGEWKVTKPVTCTEDGEETRTCSHNANHTETRSISKTGHNWSEWKTIKEATEEEEGLEERTCSNCSEKETRTIPKLNHVHSLIKTDAKNPTCEENGNIQYWHCDKCGRYFSDSEGKNEINAEDIVVKALGHKYEFSTWKWSEDNSTAEAEFVCANDSSHKETVPATVTSETVAAICETAGKTTFTVKTVFEGKEYTDSKEVTISALGHDYGEWKVTKLATCTEDGTETRTCSHNASHTETRAIPKTGHKYSLSEWKWSEDNSTAEAEFICTNDSSHKEIVSATVTSETCAATCETAGKTTYIAKTVFEEKEYTDTKEVILQALGHDYGEWTVTKPATCTEDGTETRTCSHDASHTETRVIPKTGHSWSEWKTVKEATEEEEGLEERTCSNCSEKETRSIPKLNHVHNLIKTDAKNPTCEENGNIQYWHCEKCGRYFSDSEGKNEINAEDIVVKALDHAYEFSTWTWNEDYTKATAVFVCSRDASHKIEKAATITSETVDAKCEEVGKTTYTAKASFEEKEYTDTKEVTIPALSHDYGEWKITKPATCTEDGTETRTCSHDASHTETRTVEKTGHNWSEWTIVKEATEKEEGLEERTCSNCSEKETRKIPVKEKPFQFDDVQDPERSFYAPVYWAVEKGITKGTSDTTFSPGNPCTRAQFVTFLWRQQGMPEPSLTTSPFKDVQDKKLSYYKAVLWALEKGITTGTSDTTFSPGKTCTRAQVVTFLWRANNKPKPKTTKNPFSDVKAGLSYSDAVLWAYENKITTGTSATTFAPGNPCTRAQTVTFLYRTYADQ